MVGRQVLTINKAFTLNELEQFMQENWNKEEYSDFRIDKPTKLSVDEYILLPATQRFLVIVYPKAAGGFFNKDNKIVLSVADTPGGAERAFAEYIPTKSPIFSLWQTSQVLSADKERTGPAEEVLQAYTAHMKEILAKHGLLK